MGFMKEWEFKKGDKMKKELFINSFEYNLAIEEYIELLNICNELDVANELKVKKETIEFIFETFKNEFENADNESDKKIIADRYIAYVLFAREQVDLNDEEEPENIEELEQIIDVIINCFDYDERMRLSKGLNLIEALASKNGKSVLKLPLKIKKANKKLIRMIIKGEDNYNRIIANINETRNYLTIDKILKYDLIGLVEIEKQKIDKNYSIVEKEFFETFIKENNEIFKEGDKL